MTNLTIYLFPDLVGSLSVIAVAKRPLPLLPKTPLWFFSNNEPSQINILAWRSSQDVELGQNPTPLFRVYVSETLEGTSTIRACFSAWFKSALAVDCGLTLGKGIFVNVSLPPSTRKAIKIIRLCCSIRTLRNIVPGMRHFEQENVLRRIPFKVRAIRAKIIYYSLWRRANARNVSFSISVRWSIYIINSADKPNFRVLPYWFFR